MAFINPMWDNEAERIGKQKCTPVGYALHGASDLIGFIALLLLAGIPLYLIYCALTGTFGRNLLWLIAVPFGLSIFGSILYRFSWMLAQRRAFHYDCESREASWLQKGQRRTYKYK